MLEAFAQAVSSVAFTIEEIDKPVPSSSLGPSSKYDCYNFCLYSLYGFLDSDEFFGAPDITCF